MTTPHQAVYRLDFLSFLIRAFSILEPGKTLLPGWQHEAMAHQLDRCAAGTIKRLVMTMPPRSLKSITVSVAWTAFLLGLDPSAKIMCISYNEDLAKTHSRSARRLMDSQFFRQLFPRTILAKSTELELETTLGGLRYATSIGGTVTGRGADWIIIDDPSKAEDALSKPALEKVIAFYNSTLSTRLNDPTKGRIILVMQRLHELDLAGHFLAGDEWSELTLSAQTKENCVIPTSATTSYLRTAGELLDPVRLPLAYLQGREREMGSAAYQAQYQQAPVPAEGNIIKRQWLCHYRTPPPFDTGRIIQSLDTAQKTDPAHDFSVLTTWLWVGDKYYLLDVRRGKFAYPDLKAMVIAQYDRYRPERILIEDAGCGISLAQDLAAQRPDILTKAIKPKVSKEVRVASASALFENQQVLFPADASWLDECEREVLGFPGARHDDIVDSIAQFLNWVRDEAGSGYFASSWSDPSQESDSGGGMAACWEAYHMPLAAPAFIR